MSFKSATEVLNIALIFWTEINSTLWEIASAMQREKPEQQSDTSMYGMPPSC